jgi:UDP-glucose 4-epimerase
MNLLLTGASGFLGKNLLLHCPENWRILALYCRDTSLPEFVAGLNRPHIQTARCDFTKLGQVAALIERYGGDWDGCLYLAAKVDIPWSVQQPTQDLLENTVPLLNLLERTRVRKFVYFSSGSVYDGLQGEVHPDDRIQPTLPYAISKLASERYVQFFAKRKRTIEDYLIVRFFGAYGPYEAPHKIYTRVICALALEGKSTYTIYGGGQNLIDAMYVDDAVDAIQRIFAGNHWNDIVNLAGGCPVTIEMLVRQIGEALGIRSVKIEKRGIAHESNQFWGSTREMRDYFGFQPLHSIAVAAPRFRQFLERSLR